MTDPTFATPLLPSSASDRLGSLDDRDFSVACVIARLTNDAVLPCGCVAGVESCGVCWWPEEEEQ